MKRNFQVVDLMDQVTGRYLGQALYCAERKECPFFSLNSRPNTGEALEAFVEGARQVGGAVNLYHINMPIEINSRNVPYSEIRNTIVGEMEMRTTRIEQDNEQEIKQEFEDSQETEENEETESNQDQG